VCDGGASGIVEDAVVYVVEAEVELGVDERDASESVSPPSRGTTTTSWSGHTPPTLARTGNSTRGRVLTQRPCPIVDFSVPVLEGELGL
jgi:hypothetical protein